MILYGKNPVLERIRKDPDSIIDLYLQKRTDLSSIVREAKKCNIDFKSVDKKYLLSEFGQIHSQGVVAIVRDYLYCPAESIIKDCLDSKTVPILLDGITDPQNFGGIIRTLACLGGYSLMIPEYGAAKVTDSVLRVANGGENHINIAMVPNIATLAGKMKELGINIAGAVADGGADIRTVAIKYPFAVVIGSEGKGIRPGVLKHITCPVTIEMAGAHLSFNAVVATAIICFSLKTGKEPKNKRGKDEIL